MFAYCDNNPVNRADPSGHAWESIIGAFIDGAKRVLGVFRDCQAHNEDAYLSTTQRQQNATLIYDFLISEGWSHNAICAVLGNMEQESTINPGLHQRNGSGFGIVQWDPASKYTDWADANGYAYNSLTGQLEYLIYSMQRGKGEWFKNSKYPDYYLSSDVFICSNASIEFLTAIFLHSYERAGTPMLDKRISYALYWSEYFS